MPSSGGGADLAAAVESTKRRRSDDDAVVAALNIAAALMPDRQAHEGHCQTDAAADFIDYMRPASTSRRTMRYMIALTARVLH